MSTTHAQIETTGDHVYLIRVSGDGEVIETTLYADPGRFPVPDWRMWKSLGSSGNPPRT